MKKSLQLASAIACLVILSPVNAAGPGGGGGGQRSFGNDSSMTQKSQRMEAEESVRKRMENSPKEHPGDTVEQRERMESKVEQRTRDDNGDQTKAREQTRTTQETQTEKGPGSGKADASRKTARKWWEFWK